MAGRRALTLALTALALLVPPCGICAEPAKHPPAATSASAPGPGLAHSDGPRLRADGPDAARYGMLEGYPRCEGLAFVREDRCRVGAFSHFDSLFPARMIRAPSHPSPFKRSSTEAQVRYEFAGQQRSLAEYLDRRPITGFLIAKGDTILVERYQYGRRDSQRLTSFSMAKSILGLLVGIAVEEGAIRSIDDVAQDYVPGLAGHPYGRTPIRALLEMRSGVFFREDYQDPASDIYTLARLTLEQDPAGSLGAVKRFDHRRAAPGQVYSYSSADSVVLGLVLAAATRRPLSDYATERLWKPLGAEADASWIIDATGQEVAYGYFNAVLRDWARLGALLANLGERSGKAIVPRQWLLASLQQPIDTESLVKYGRHLWLSPDAKRFMLWGLRGQTVLADPDTKLVLVQTALDSGGFLDLELATLWAAVRAQLR